MIVREYTDADLTRIQELHTESGFDYQLPDPSIFFSKRVISDESGIGMAAFMRLNAEAYLICDPEWRTTAWRYEALKQMHSVCNSDAKAAGAQEALSFLPPEVEKRFGSRLVRMGWDRCRTDWHCFFKRII